MSRVADARSVREIERTLSWIGERVRGWLFMRASAGELGWYRAAFFGLALTLSFAYQADFPRWSSVDDVFWQPIPFARLLPLRPLPEGTMIAVLWLWRAALLLGAVGLATRWGTVIAALLGVYVFGLPQMFGKVNHNDSMVLLGLAIFALAPCGEGWSVDAWLRAARTKRLHDVPRTASGDRSARHGWPVQILRLLIVTVLFSSAIAKLQASGFREWALSDNLSRLMLSHHYTRHPPTMLATTVAATPWLGTLLASGALSVELLSPILLVLRGRLRVAGGIAVASMFVGFWLGLGVLFLHLILLLLLAFVPWPNIGRWLREARWSAPFVTRS